MTNVLMFLAIGALFGIQIHILMRLESQRKINQRTLETFGFVNAFFKALKKSGDGPFDSRLRDHEDDSRFREELH